MSQVYRPPSVRRACYDATTIYPTLHRCQNSVLQTVMLHLYEPTERRGQGFSKSLLPSQLHACNRLTRVQPEKVAAVLLCTTSHGLAYTVDVCSFPPKIGGGRGGDQQTPQMHAYRALFEPSRGIWRRTVTSTCPSRMYIMKVPCSPCLTNSSPSSKALSGRPGLSTPVK